MSAAKEQEQINTLLREQNALRKEAKQQLADAGAITTQQIKEFRDANPAYKERIDRLKQINEELREQRDTQKTLVDNYVAQESRLKNLTGLQASLATMEHKRLNSMTNMRNLDVDRRKTFDSISSLQQELLTLSSEDVIARREIGRQLDAHYADLEGVRGVHSHIRKNLLDQRSIAEGVSQMTEKQQKFLNGQLAVYEGIKDTIGGILETADLLLSTTGGKLGAAMIGVGYAVDEIGKSMRSFGGFSDSAQLSAIGLGFAFKDSEGTLKSLSSEMGGMKDISFQTQLNANLMATNMGITGDESAKLIGSFARLNGNSTDTAMNLAASTKELAKANGIPIDQIMKDVSASSETFAEYGKDGGKNIAEAAVAAAKLGVNMGSLTKVTDSLLDFESSITKELELGAMLGKNINLDRARALAYEGSIGGAVKETLSSLGGIEAFNKMDIFSKRKAAELLGLSVDEFQKMAANSDKLNDNGTIQLSTFDSTLETLTAISTGPMAGMLKTMGSVVIGAAQMGGSFAQMGFDVKGIAGKMGGLVKSSAEFIKNMASNVLQKFGGGAISTATQSIADVAGSSLADKAKDTIKDKASDLLDNKIDSVISPEGVEEATESMNKDKSMGEKLQDLAKGLKSMGNTKVLFGALNLIPTALGLVAMVAGIPSMYAISLVGIPAGAGLLSIASGLKAMGNSKVLFGSLTLFPLALGLVAMVAGIPSLAAIAFVGVPAGLGLAALGKGLQSFGKAAPEALIGIGLLALFGLALIPFTYALSLLAPLVISIGTAIGSVIESIGKGIASVVGAITQMMVSILPLLSIEAAVGLYALAGGFLALSASLGTFAIAGLLAIPAMLAVGTFLEIGGGSVIETLNGGGEGGKGAEDKNAKMDELINEIKALRTDLNSGKIAVHMDGKKVTSGVSKVVSTVSSNSYALK